MLSCSPTTPTGSDQTTEAEVRLHQPSASPVLELAARVIDDGGFRWRARFWHLAYRGHVPAEHLISKLASITSICTLGHSVVHERSDAQVPYDHTHFAWMWERAPNLHGSWIMDIELDGVRLHPHMVHKKSLKWLQYIFQRYHHGHKTSAAGKPTFVSPVGGPWQVPSPAVALLFSCLRIPRCIAGVATRL